MKEGLGTRLLRHRWLASGIALAALLCGVLAVYAMLRWDLIAQGTQMIDKNTPAPLFLLLFLLLPLVGMPMSVFIFVLGVKFGAVYGILILALIMPLHILVSFFIARWVRQPLLAFLVERRNYRIPEIPPGKMALFCFLFLAVPVVPYAAKNYILPLAGAPFRYCVWMNWAVQGALAIPFVFLGKSAADMNVLVFGITLAVLAVLFVLLRWIRRWYEALQ
ncbi:MAG: hypothetical protein R6X08_02275 [Desulfosalsimonadaceae bacterium]